MSSQLVVARLLPETNQLVAEYLFILEVGLRELIIQLMADVHGSQWWKRLPKDVRQKYLRGKQAERAANWTSHVEHHPLYYVDFPDLAKVISTNWTDLFARLSSDKGMFLSALKSVEPVRNKLAHNRKISLPDCELIRGVMAIVESSIGTPQLIQLVTRCSDAPSIRESMGELVAEVVASRDAMAVLAESLTLSAWPRIRSAWWFNAEFLTATDNESRLELALSTLDGLKEAVAAKEQEIEHLRSCAISVPVRASVDTVVTPVVAFFELHDEYAALPRSRGTGHKLEAWLKKSNVTQAADMAVESLSKIRRGASNE